MSLVILCFSSKSYSLSSSSASNSLCSSSMFCFTLSRLSFYLLIYLFTSVSYLNFSSFIRSLSIKSRWLDSLIILMVSLNSALAINACLSCTCSTGASNFDRSLVNWSFNTFSLFFSAFCNFLLIFLSRFNLYF